MDSVRLNAQLAEFLPRLQCVNLVDAFNKLGSSQNIVDIFTEADAEVGDGHEVLVALDHDVGEVAEEHLQHPGVGVGQLLHQSVHLQHNSSHAAS